MKIMINMKIIKRVKSIFALCVFCAIICASCACMSCEAKPIDINVKDLAEYIGGDIDLSNTVEYDEAQIKNYYGIDSADVKQIIVLKELDVNSAEALILAEAADNGKVQEIIYKLKEIKGYKLTELKDYTANPDNERQYYIVEGAEIWSEQNYIFWAVSSQSKDIDKMIKDYIKNN